MSDDRAADLALTATGLAAGAGIDLPDSLLLWGLAGGRPEAAPIRSEDPADELDGALEASLDESERRRGAHHTPQALAQRVAAMALDAVARATSNGTQRATGEAVTPSPATVVDPACGGGALLLAAGRLLVEAGLPAEVVARDLLWGADISPLAAAVTEAGIALWSGGTAPAPGHVVVADTLAVGRGAWPSMPGLGFDALVGNPPFQGQLGSGTSRSRSEAAALRRRFGEVVTPYVDTAALFLMAGSGLVRPGGSMAMILPQSIVAASGSGPARAVLAQSSHLRELWAPEDRVFDANVHVCIAAMDVLRDTPEHTTGVGDLSPAPGTGPARAVAGSACTTWSIADPHRAPARARVGATAVADPADEWSEQLAAAWGLPELDLSAVRGSVGDIATAVAGFRDEYYGLVGHVREAGPEVAAPLVTSGSIDSGSCSWGKSPIRFAKHRWQRPEVDLTSLAADNPKLAAWVTRIRRSKVLVASQTRVVEAWADGLGTAVPVTPVISVMPTGERDAAHIAALLCSPPMSAWAARRAAGTALSPRAMRVSAGLILAAPLPVDESEWLAASEALEQQDLATYARHATAMYRLPNDVAAEVTGWWRSNAPGMRP